MQKLRRDFTERFGREPGTEDPLFSAHDIDAWEDALDRHLN
ncbi:hypothetical protein R4P64_30225 [Rhodococcus sp. IEGM 1366]|nr:hypothetical protein [Rhodococcus sp. IEGM 1366]MDV8070805.1 hypothetical protein [Rhodococcus sp. IEGM 1366]